MFLSTWFPALLNYLKVTDLVASVS